MKGNIKKYQTLATIYLSVLLTCIVLQFWYTVIYARTVHISLSPGSYGISVIPYGVSLAVALFVFFSFLKKNCSWNVVDTGFWIAEILVFVAMTLHVFIQSSLDGDYAYAFFNVPICYLIGSGTIGLIWIIYRIRPQKQSAMALKIVYYCTIAVFAAMAIHVTVAIFADMLREGLHSSPSYLMGFIVGWPYLLGLIALFITYGILCFRQRAKKKKAEKLHAVEDADA